MRPTPAAIMAGTTRRVTRNVPRMLTLNTRSHSAGVTSRKSVGELTPATFASPIIGGSADSTSEMAASTDASSEMSAPTPRVVTEYLSATSAAASLAATPSMSRIATDHPSRANRSAVARPIPRGDAPPVTTAVRSDGNAELMVGLPSGRGYLSNWHGRRERCHVSSCTAVCRVSSCAGLGWSSATRVGPAGRPCIDSPALISAMSAPPTASTACLIRLWAAPAAWSSPCRHASASSRNGRGKMLETPDTVTGIGVQPPVVIHQCLGTGRQVVRGDRGQVCGAHGDGPGGESLGLPGCGGADMDIHRIRPVHLERPGENGASFVVVQCGELAGRARNEHPGHAGLLQVAQQRLLALWIQVTVGLEGHRNGGQQGGGRGHDYSRRLAVDRLRVRWCELDCVQCESRVTVSPLDRTRKSRSTPRSACMTWST